MKLLREVASERPAAVASPRLRRLRTGTHRSGNLYWESTNAGEPGDDGQVGYVRIGELAEAMVSAYNAWIDGGGHG